MSLVYDNTGDVMSYSHNLTMYRDEPASTDVTFSYSRDDGDAMFSIEKWPKNEGNAKHVVTLYEEEYDRLRHWMLDTAGLEKDMIILDTTTPGMQIKVAGGKENNLRFVKVKPNGKKVALVLNTAQRERLYRWFNRTKA